MVFDIVQLIARIARPCHQGPVSGRRHADRSDMVSTRDRARGSAGLAEQRTIATLEREIPGMPILRPDHRVWRHRASGGVNGWVNRLGQLIFVSLIFGHFCFGAAPLHARSTDPVRADYVVMLEGVDDAELKASLEAASLLFTNRETPPATIRQLQRRIDTDIKRLADVLRSRGFYGHMISDRVNLAERPLVVIVSIEPGPPYRLSDYQIFAAGAPLAESISVPFETLGVSLGMVAAAKPVRQAEIALARYLIDRGYPFADITDRRNIVDHNQQSLAVTTVVSAGPRAVFGDTTIVGLSDVSRGVVQSRIAWRAGDIFAPDKVARTRRNLTATQLFSSVTIDHADSADPANRLAMRVVLIERKARSVGAGAGFATDKGFQGRVFWEHRNLLGSAEKLRSTVRAGQTTSSAEAALTLPWFGSPRQDLLLNSLAARDRTDAFDRESIGAGVTLRRRLTDRINGTIGGEFEWENVKDHAEDRIFTLVSAPATLTYDSSDDALDPSRGVRAHFAATPYLTARDSDLAFVWLQLAQSFYWQVVGDNGPVLAARYRLGGIVGEEADDLPISKRFSAGGGGSVRGFEFQSIGPRDVDGNPFGGRSLLEVGAELRLRVTDEIGVVPFIDGGQVYHNSLPQFDVNLHWGAGLGVRYFTPVGPLRLDVAAPVNRRRNIDDAFQFYISLGQAF